MGNTQSTAPYGAQINQINYELNCDLYYSQNLSVAPNVTTYTNFSFSTTSPLTGGSGQSIYYSDVVGDFSVPAFELDLGNYTSWTMNITTNFELSNASPANATIQRSISSSSNGTNFAFTSVPLGPFILGAIDASHSLQLALVTANYTFYMADGVPGLQGSYQCRRPTDLPIISTTYIDTSTGPALAPSNSGGSVFPSTPLGRKYSLANIPMYCEPNGYRQSRAYNLSIAATVGLAVDRSNTNLILEHTSAYITVPGSVVYSLDSIYGAASDILILTLGSNHAGSLPGATGLGATFIDAGPQYFDIAGNYTDTPNPLATYRYVVPSNRSNPPIPIAASGTVDVGPFVVTARYPEIFAVDSPSFYGYVQGYSTDYGQQTFVGEVPAQCDAISGMRLFSIPIVQG